MKVNRTRNLRISDSVLLAFCAFLIMLFISINMFAQNQDIPFKQLGKVKPRLSTEIPYNNWTIGAETMDRDLVEFNSFKDHLEELGAKQIRLQAGWARCEQEKGKYNWAWLDTIIDGVIARGVEPWLQTSYGNPIYEGGGGIHLSAGFPTSELALEAWDNWVRALAKRYAGRVKIWEIWNEPDNKGKNTAEDYAHFYIRTAQVIREVIPEAHLYSLALANSRDRGRKYTETFFEILKQKDKIHLVTDVCMHGYTYNPGDIYPEYKKMAQLIKRYSNDIVLRQGEIGCPSEFQTIYALRNYEWTETSQSKWVTRKMMGDLGRDIPSHYFLIIDIVYTHNHEELMDTPKRNTKGLILSDLQRNFVQKKPAFRTYQSVTSIFDNNLERIPNYGYITDADTSISLFAYREKLFDSQIVTVWMDSETPTNTNQKTPMSFEFSAGNFKNPVYVDLRTGNVFEIPKSNYEKRGSHYIFNDIPIYDSAILIADKSLVVIEE